MHDGDYRNILGLDLVYDAEWKPGMGRRLMVKVLDA
jgi:hypothetical protein